MTAVFIALGVIAMAAIAVGSYSWGRRTREVSRAASGRHRPAVTAVVAQRPAVVDEVVIAVDPEPDRVAVKLIGSDTAVVFGESSAVAAFGSKLDSLPNAVSRGVAAGNVALQSLLIAGSASGQLVRLTAESAAALKALSPMVDSSGAILGVVKNGSGQFAKVLRFTSVDGLSAAASLGPALTSLALQLQLQAISKQLMDVKRIAEGIAQHQTDELAASVETNIDLLAEAYRKLEQTGTISDSEWAGLAPLRKSIEDNVRLIGKKVDAGIEKINGVARNGSYRWAGDRLSMLDDIDRREKPLMWIDLYVQAQRAVVMGEFPSLHRFVATNDPHLEVHRHESEQRVSAAEPDPLCRTPVLRR